ncbi:hypothetical protein K474DRAFT_1713471 [Panus rudis PR-1116 ss-1]|nr:hypothetical protein K474DRAFT_1713471 [Panus rudis PR-1116 ss-1]
MHRCFEVSELLETIINYAAFPVSPTEAFDQYMEQTKTALNLAMTCRLFLEPSLDALWHTQCGIWRLVQCLLNDLYMVKKHENSEGYYWEFVRKPEEDDWKRFIYYGTRIKKLYLSETPFCENGRTCPPVPSLDAYRMLPKPLLPDLRCLDWERYNDAPQKLGPVISTFAGSPVLEALSVSYTFVNDAQARNRQLLSEHQEKPHFPNLANCT